MFLISPPVQSAYKDELIYKVVTMQLSHRLLRNLHLATTPVLGAFVYASPLREHATFFAIVQWGVFPVVAGAGLLMWIRPWLARRTAEARREDQGEPGNSGGDADGFRRVDSTSGPRKL
jgi:hypothetical protein